jgi:hypothetical protein
MRGAMPLLYIYVYVQNKGLLLEKNPQYALIFTTPLFYELAPTSFGSRLPSSGSFLDPSELLEI